MSNFKFVNSANFLHKNKKKIFNKNANNFLNHNKNDLNNRMKLKNRCFIYVHETRNNVFVTARNFFERTITSMSSGYSGFKGPSRNTSHAVEQLGIKFGSFLNEKMYTEFEYIARFKFSRNVLSICNSLESCGLKFVRIRRILRKPHNGMRKKKVRRV